MRGESRDELDERIRELAQEAQSEYTEDPVAAILGYLQDMENDLGAVTESQAFADGYGYAIHHVEEMYIRHASSFECECRYPLPEEHITGRWQCADCGETLVAEDESILDEREP